MNGQWIGTFTGTNNGSLIVELDDVGGGYEGFFIAIDQNPALPNVRGDFIAPKNSEKFSLRVFLTAVDRATGNPILADALKSTFPTAIQAKYTDSNWSVSDKQIDVSWSSDLGTNGIGIVHKSAGHEDAKLVATEMDWNQFKEHATGLEPARFVFRGQGNNRWKLRTSFHRTGRANLHRFMRQDVSALYRHMTGLAPHRFNLENSLDYAAFLALVQHHGYPTPLLDWTLSPFIAAYFAFKNAKPRELPEADKVRLHVLDTIKWNSMFEKAQVLAPAFLYMTILEPLALNNPRVLPQQGLFAVTNVDDLEKYIADREMERETTFLTAIDISISERPKVMKELALMGINAGSLFPGLDGACEQLKERYFSIP
jgi:hypothetical protein